MVVQNEYLVNYGRTAALGRFVSRADSTYTRGDKVLVGSIRGIESGTVLCEASPRFAHLVGAASGELLRSMTDDDADREHKNHIRVRALVDNAQLSADELGLPVAVLDAELPIDGDNAILHCLPLADCDLSHWISMLAERNGLIISILDLRQAPKEEPEGCGKPGCGTKAGGCTDCGTGGCSSGSCSSGKVKSADEMTTYFSNLRKQMHEHFDRVPLHG